MDIKEQVSRRLHELHRTQCKRMFEWDMEKVSWEELDSVTRLRYRTAADQIIPIVRADCQREMATYLEQLSHHVVSARRYRLGITPVSELRDLRARLATHIRSLESGTFKAEGRH